MKAGMGKRQADAGKPGFAIVFTEKEVLAHVLTVKQDELRIQLSCSNSSHQ